MSNPICYIPVKGIDDVIASNVDGWNPSRAALLRGLYDESHSTPLNTSDLKQAAATLANYRKEMSQKNAKAIRTQSTNLAAAFRQTKRDFSAEERFDRVNMIAAMFSNVLDRIQIANPGVTRTAICNGFTAQGRQVAGEISIFEKVFDQLLDRRNFFLSKGYTAQAESINKVLDNWGALVSMARMRLRDTENLKLGNKLEYADEANLDNFGDNVIEQLYTAEESTREHWQETNNLQSSFGSVSAQVRRFLGTIQEVDENGKPKFDDLGFPKMADAVKTHQALMEKLRGVTSQSQMLGILRNAAKNEVWIRPILAGLEERKDAQGKDITNYQLRTQFFVDFKKNFQPYSILLEDVKDKIRTYRTKILNRVQNALAGNYLTRVTLGQPVNSKTSVFDKKGNINWENLQRVRATIKEYFPSKSITINPKFYDKNQTSWVEKKQVLTQLTQALGIDVDANTLQKIMLNGRDLHKFTDNLSQLVEFGFEKVLDKATLTALDNGQYSSLPSTSYKQFIKTTPQASTAKEGVIREKINKMLEIVTKNREGLRLESRARHKDAKGNNISLFSDVAPSFLGDFIGKINRFAEQNDKNGLKKFLETQFLDSSMFKDGDTILNKWIEDLINGSMDEKGFAAQFQYKRFMGTADNSFENFTSKQHAIDMLAEYWSEKQLNNPDYAMYPVFILGDSGVAKYIRAKRYSAQDILDGMYNVYRSERRRMEQAKAANAKLTSEGYKLIDNFSANAERYCVLPFLNEDFVAADGTTGKYAAMVANPTEQNVKNAIKEYMKEATENFKKSLDNLGILETQETWSQAEGKNVTQYTYLSQEVKNPNELDKVLADFYWNTKFATIMQLQLMTIDPSFYKGTKDLQKRYKEIHAPGTSLDLEARNQWSDKHELFNPLDENGNPQPERCVYFDDIDLNAEDYDPNFMEAIANHFGKNSSIYKTYKKNTLTDGQGYRTLESYRKVLGMAGKWTQEMENAYNEIQSLRAKIGKDTTASADDLARIGELAVVFQPIKPYMYTIENYALNDTDKLKIPVQHKYAEAVIIPELLPAGSKLRDMAYWMEEHVDENGKSAPIDLIGSTKIVKVGGFGSANIKGVDSTEKLNAALDKGYVHQLNYGDYRIQTNVPEHINSSQLFGTQVRKLIMAGIKMDDYRYESYVNGNKVNLGGKYKNVRLTGRNLNAFYNSLIVANILDSYNKFEGEISDPKEVSNILIQSTINNSRESMDNLLAFALDNNGDFQLPLFEGGLEHDSSALLFSIFKKRVNKQTIKGGSAVQVSAMGINGYTEDGDLHYITDSDKKNVLYAEIEMPFDLSYSYTDENGHEVSVPLNYEDWCNEDGTLKLDTSKELDITKRENRMYQSYYTTDSNGKKHYYKPLIEVAYPDILSILAYRIPTERDYSMINARIKRFSQKTAGGTMKVPAQGTTIAGFDFDIDKLYFMRKEFSTRQLTPDEVAEVWEAIYKANPSMKAALKDVKNQYSKAQDFITDFLNVFTNSELAQGVAETTPEKDRLWKYWKEAGLEGSPKEFFSKFMKENPSVLEQIRGEKSGFEEYDYTKSPLENSRAARNNMLIHLIQERLMDEETFEARYTPGGFANASNAARTLRELLFGDTDGIVNNGMVDFDAIDKRIAEGAPDPEPNYDPSDPLTILTYNQQNQVAGKLIGIFANQNTNHAFASLMKEFKLADTSVFEFCGHAYTDFLHAPKGVNVDLNVAEFLSASVDAVKDPVLNFLNLNTITADSGAILARLGYTTKEIGLLFNQPVIKMICEYSFNNSVGVEEAIRQVTNDLKNEVNDKAPKFNPSVNFSTNQLAKNILYDRLMREQGKSAMDNASFRENQLKVAELFQQIQKVAGDVSQFVTSSKFTASNAVGSTFGDLYAQQMKVAKYVSRFNSDKSNKDPLSVVMLVKEASRTSDAIISPINNDADALDLSDQEYLERLIENPLAYEQAMYDANRKVKRLLSKYYPYETPAYKASRNKLASLTKSGTLDADTINSIHDELMVYMITNQGGLFDGSFPCKKDSEGNNILAREYYTEHFPKEVFDFLESNPKMKELPIFQYLQIQTLEYTNPKTGALEERISMNIQDIGGLAPYMKEGIKDSWAELYNTHPELARDLFMYNFYKLGFTFSPLSFMNLAPVELKLNLRIGEWNNKIGDFSKSYVDFLKEVQKGEIGVNYDTFAQQFILNHLDNKKLVYTPKGDYLKAYLKEAKPSGVFLNRFTLNLSEIPGKLDQRVFTLSPDGIKKDQIAFKPCIVVDGITYMAHSNNMDGFNISDTGSMTYIKVEALGTKNKSLQYNATSTKARPNVEVADSQEQGSTQLDMDPEVPGDTFDRAALENEIIEAKFQQAIAEGTAMAEDKNSFSADLHEQLKGYGNKDILDTVEFLREEARKKGIIVLDENGKPKPSC